MHEIQLCEVMIFFNSITNNPINRTDPNRTLPVCLVRFLS